MSEPEALAQWYRQLTGTKDNNACLKHLCSDAEFASHELRVVAVELAIHELRSVAVSSNTQRRTPSS